MAKEQWKQYKDSPYLVSNLGRVSRDEKILKSRLNPAGYDYANLSYDGVSKQPAVHEMVLEAFNVPKPKGVKNPIVKHKNNKKNDNRLENLEWGTISDNTEDAYDDGLVDKKGANNPDNKTSDHADNSNPCWEGYKQLGTKYKDGQQVPNCVNESEPQIPDGWASKPSNPPKNFIEPPIEAPDGWKIKK